MHHTTEVRKNLPEITPVPLAIVNSAEEVFSSSDDHFLPNGFSGLSLNVPLKMCKSARFGWFTDTNLVVFLQDRKVHGFASTQHELRKGSIPEDNVSSNHVS